jgi:hypothetical protein
LYFIIAFTASALGMAPASAFSYPLGIISIMNRMVVFSFSEFLTLLERRTTQSKIDGGVTFQQEFLH